MAYTLTDSDTQETWIGELDDILAELNDLVGTRFTIRLTRYILDARPLPVAFGTFTLNKEEGN